jgi:hypothetical protein
MSVKAVFKLARHGRAAATFAVAYLLCMLAPPLALALADSAEALHCLTARYENRLPLVAVDKAATPHSHEAHSHHDTAGEQDHLNHDAGAPLAGGMDVAADCCGYLCLSAIPVGPVPCVGPQERIFTTEARRGESIAGRDPDRIDRPPIVLLPV